MLRTRRQWLGAAAALACTACGMTGRKAQPAPRRQGVVLNVRCDVVAMAASSLRSAWKAVHPRVSLNIQPLRPLPGANKSVTTGWSVSQLLKEDDVFQMEGDGYGGFASQVLDLTPLLRARNFAPSDLVSPSSFALEGRQYGLPLWLEPMALLVNNKLAASLGIAPRSGAWTLDAVEVAVSQAVYRQGKVVPNLIVGVPWTDVRIWGAFALGFGGHLTGSTGGLDFGGPPVGAATTRLITLAAQAGWYSGVGPGRMGIVGTTFTGSVASALFCIQNVPVYFKGETHGGLKYTRFPLLPIYPLIPVASAYGLAISPHSANIETALEFILWLYESAQQRVLMAVGVPPIVRLPALQQAYRLERAVPANVLDVADPRYLRDVVSLLPRIVYGGYTPTLAADLSKALRDPKNVSYYLSQVQSSLAQQIARTAATCAKVPTPDAC